jgi:hypothetical protein
MRSLIIAVGFLGVLLSYSIAQAHQPTVSDGTAIDFEHAIEFTDIQVSRVVYHEVSAEAPQLWISFQVGEPQELRLQLGLPLLDRLVDYRPALALLGPDLPEVTLPFEIPVGLGGQIYLTDDVTDPVVFDEPFSGTSSWILFEDDIELPAAGRYYVVAYVPSEELGKLWVALGILEEFDLTDTGELFEVVGQVRDFHEVEGSEGLPCLFIPLVPVVSLFVVHRMRRRFKSVPKSGKFGTFNISFLV